MQFIKEETQRCGIEILSWCLMTNHVHFVVVPHDESSLAKGFGEAHKRYTRMKNFSEGVRGYLFQGRFGSCVLDERHLLAAVRYVENNPAAAGIVNNAWEYPWSSAAYHVGSIEDDALVKDRSLYGLVNDWRIYLGEEENDIFNTIRKATRTGRPAGWGWNWNCWWSTLGTAWGSQAPGISDTAVVRCCSGNCPTAASTAR